MNYLIFFLLIFLFSCSSDKDKDLVDVEYYMKQGKEVSILNNFKFNEIKKINKLLLSNPLLIDNWLSHRLNASNNLPRFNFEDFKKKTSININVKSFLVLKKYIYVIDENSNLIILNENLKELKKKTIYKKKEFKHYKLEFSMTSDGKNIYISDNLGNLRSVDIESLQEKWFLKLGVPINSNLYLNNGDLFFINNNNKMYAIKSLNGEIKWSNENASKISKEKYKISISNNFLVSNNDYGEIYILDLIQKNLLWKLSLKDQDYQVKLKNFKVSYPVISDGILYFSSNFGETIAIEVNSGKILWRKLVSSTNLPIINNNFVFLINEKGYFHILNKNNGEVIFSIDLNRFNQTKNNIEIFYYDMILGKNYIYFLNSGTNLIKLDINNLKLIISDNYSLKNPKNFFILNNYLYILEDNKLSKFHN